MDSQNQGIFAKALQKLAVIEQNEIKATFASMLFVFILMASYYILRPVRDAMASDWSDTEVAFLWQINFLVSACIVALYGFIISRVQLKRVIPVVYATFAATFVAFYIVAGLVGEGVLVDKAFYLWVSVFALFNVSVFWTFMADTFNKEQAKRLFAIIATGASAGALVGPAIPALFAGVLGTDTLMLIASVGLLLVIPLAIYIYHLKATDLGNTDVHADLSAQKMGGKWWAGFSTFATNPFLMGIGAFILLYVFIGSFVYFEQKNLLEIYSREERTQILGSIDLITNLLTFGMAFFLTGRIVTKLGMPFALALLPFAVCIALIILAFAPVLVALLALQVARRSGNYAITRPAREMLFTHVTKEERFKAKPVVDVVVYRGGDAISGTLFALLTDGIGLGLAAVALVGAVISALWGWVGIKLGRSYEGKEAEQADQG